ncbi:MAG: DUF1801 domain-containing protein [Acidimicrobiales bacterium]
MNEIDAFVEAIETPWQKDRCRGLLAAQRRASADIHGAIKWQNPYFTRSGKYILKWYLANDWINVYFARGNDVADPKTLFEESTNKKMKLVRIFADTDFDLAAYEQLVATAAALEQG